MFDNRDNKIIDLGESELLKEGVAYKFTDKITGKELVAKLIADYNDSGDDFLVAEFRKLARLSSEPEIGGVYFLATAKINESTASCYIMDFIPGKTLGRILSEEPVISYDHAVDIVSDIALGLEKAHHFDVFHSDLHDNNLIIDRFGKVKIVDFLWNDYRKSSEEKYLKDLDNFKGIVKRIFEKCSDVDKKRFRYIDSVCQESVNFFGLSTRVKTLDDITLDLVRINTQGKLLISKLLNGMPLDISQVQHYVGNDISIPDRCLCINSRANYYDKRALDIQNCLENAFYKVLHQLKSAELIDLDIRVNNSGERNKGPYSYSYRIDLRSKAFKWYLMLHQHYFLPSPFDEPFHEYITNQA